MNPITEILIIDFDQIIRSYSKRLDRMTLYFIIAFVLVFPAYFIVFNEYIYIIAMILQLVLLYTAFRMGFYSWKIKNSMHHFFELLDIALENNYSDDVIISLAKDTYKDVQKYTNAL